MHEPLPRRVASVVTHNVHRDFETCGEGKFGEGRRGQVRGRPVDEVLCAAYAVDDGPVQVWLPGREPIPAGD